jgi:plasmid stabilization system protein ParE
LAPECRSALYESHVIFFRIRAQNIEVMRILHAGMDFGRHLADEEPSV